MNFDTQVNRIGTHCSKWDELEGLFGIPVNEALAMWVADMEFAPPASVQRALEAMTAHGIYGYFGEEGPYRQAICDWMARRHGWSVDPAHIFTTHGLVNGVGLCIEAFTAPGDGVVLMTPVYHAFARVTQAAEREVVELPLAVINGRHELDFDAWEGRMTGRERMLILCSPHNPGGRVWSPDELRTIADFCTRHDLILISDEIHHDLVFPGQRHIPMAVAAPEIAARLVMMTAATKTFNIAGAHTGNVIIADPALRARFARKIQALGISPNSFGMHMVTAAYSDEGAAWLDALIAHLDENRRIFDAAINAIPGLSSMRLEATYLAWVDTSGTGMAWDEVLERVQGQAKIAANHGASFGTGGEGHLRFNLACPRAHVTEAIARLQKAFADLQ